MEKNYRINVEGSGTREELIKDFEAILKDLKNEAINLKDCLWEDSTLLTEIEVYNED